MPVPTTTSYALLGLLSLRPWTTYELAKQVQRSLGWFWPRAERKLYDEPKLLVVHGLAAATEERTGRRPRTTYRITAKGRRELRRWLGLPSRPPTLEFEGLVRVFFADAGTPEQLDATLAGIEATALERLAALAGMAATGSQFPERVAVTGLAMRYWAEYEAGIVRWARWARAQAVAGSPDPAEVVELARTAGAAV